jgi:glycosyltransferase involved in cell wall biosynthesis
MHLTVFSHKPCWSSTNSPSGYASDGGFPFQMRVLSELFDSTTLVVPCAEPISRAGEIPLEGQGLSIAPLSGPAGRGLARKLGLGFWLLRNSRIIFREVLRADAVHTPIPGDIGTIGMLLAFLMRKPLFVRHCGNWLRPVTKAEHFWKWFMEKFAGGNQVMLATGGAPEPPSTKNHAVRWIFSTTLSEAEMRSCGTSRTLPASDRARLIIVCRQDREKGTGIVIESLPLILKTLPYASLDVVGEGGSLAAFQDLAEKLGVSERIVFHGKVGHEGVIGLLKQADLFCYPTRASEGFPKVVLEALACGLPVVTTRVSVLPELIGKGGAGVLLDEVTPTVFAQAVVDVLSNHKCYQEMSAQALTTAQPYSLEGWRDTIGAHLRAAWRDRPLKEPELAVTMFDPKKLRLCFLAGTLGRGGAERQLIYMLKALQKAGIEARVLCLTRDESLEEEIRALGIRVTWVGASRWRPIRLFRIVQELRRERADILQSAHFYTNLYVAVASRLLRIEGIGAIRSNLSSELEGNGLMGWWHLHSPKHLIANSEVGRKSAINKGIKPEKVTYVPNAVDMPIHRGSVRRNGDAAIRVLFAGRLCEPKRPDRFLRVIDRLVKSRPDLKVKGSIAGDGPLRQRLEELAAGLGLSSDSIEFLGEIEDVRPVYFKSDLLLLTSDYEGTPNVVLEAMGCGLPVVATCVGGVPEVIGVDRGLTAEPDDEDGLTAATLRMIDDCNLRTALAYHGHEYVSRFHSFNALKKQLTDIYQQVLSA